MDVLPFLASRQLATRLSKWQVFQIGWLVLGRATLLLRQGRLPTVVLTCSVFRLPAAWASVCQKHVVGDDVQAGLGLVATVEIPTRFEPTPHDDAGALAQATRAGLFGHALGQPSKDGDAVPVRGVYPVSIVSPALAIVRRDPAGDDHFAVRRIAYLWIDAEVSNEG